MNWMVLTLATAAATVAATPALANDDPKCWKTEMRGTTEVRVYQGDRSCVDLTDAREIEGVWVKQFEGSRFFEGATGAEVHGSDGPRVWLTMDDRTVRPEGFAPEFGHAYRLKMVARTAVDMDRKPLEGYGHMGVSNGLVLVDSIVEWEDLGPIDAEDPLA